MCQQDPEGGEVDIEDLEEVVELGWGRGRY